MKICYRKH